jgi:ParB-like nuclease domain
MTVRQHSARVARRWPGPKWEVALVLSEFLFYLVGILATLGGILLLERIVAGPHFTAGTGYARVDSAFDFDRLRRKQYGPGLPNVLRRGRRSTLPLLQEVTREPRQLREAGEQLIPVASIVGSVDGASQLFDRNFRPVSDRARARLSSVLAAMRQGEPFPPIEVWAWRGEYYVLDGHHRVAAARALGSDYISAHVIELVELSRYDAKAVRV